jgi:hypothetical protein
MLEEMTADEFNHWMAYFGPREEKGQSPEQMKANINLIKSTRKKGR